MTEHILEKLLNRGVEAIERIATALEKIAEEPKDDNGRSVRGFSVGGTD